MLSVPATSYFLIGVALYCFFRAPSTLFYLGIFFVPFSATAVLNVYSSFGLQASIFFFACYVSAMALHRGKGILFAAPQVFALLMVLLFYLSVLSSLTLPLLAGRTEVVSLNMCVYLLANLVLVFIVASTLNNSERIRLFLLVQSASCLLLSSWGIMQALLGIAGLPYPAFVFNTSTSDAAQLFGQVVKGGLVKVGSASVEPSILVQSLMFYVSIAASVFVRTGAYLGRFGVVSLSVSIICIILSLSTTGYFGLFVLLVLLVLQRPRQSAPLVAAIVAIILGAIVVDGQLAQGLLESTVEKPRSWSFNQRFRTIETGWQAFLEAPVTGIGFASLSVYSMPVFLLANTGIIGLCSFLAIPLVLWLGLSRLHITARDLRGEQSDRRTGADALACGIRNAIVVSLTMQSVAGFTYVFADFWVTVGVAIALMRRDVSMPEIRYFQASGRG